MFPGSDLHQIKEINEKIRNTMNTIVFQLNLQSKTRSTLKRKRGEIAGDTQMEAPLRKKIKRSDTNELMMDTLNIPDSAELIKATLELKREHSVHAENLTAFSLLFKGEQYKSQAKTNNVFEVFKTWDEPVFELRRQDFVNFPKDVIAVISKKHFVISGRRTNNDEHGGGASSTPQKPAPASPAKPPVA